MQRRIRETPLLLEIENRLVQEGRALVVIDGDCGAGKTTLAREGIAIPLQGTVIPMDDFFLPPSLRSWERRRIPGGNIDFERFQAEVLESLLTAPLQDSLSPADSPASNKTWQSFTYSQYDCRSGRVKARRVIPRALVVVEGSYSMHPAFSEGYQALHALRVFLSVSRSEQLRRIRKRDPDMLKRFQEEWIPLEKAYATAYHVRDNADISLCTDGWID